MPAHKETSLARRGESQIIAEALAWEKKERFRAAPSEDV